MSNTLARLMDADCAVDAAQAALDHALGERRRLAMQFVREQHGVAEGEPLYLTRESEKRAPVQVLVESADLIGDDNVVACSGRLVKTDNSLGNVTRLVHVPIA